MNISELKGCAGRDTVEMESMLIEEKSSTRMSDTAGTEMTFDINEKNNLTTFKIPAEFSDTSLT